MSEKKCPVHGEHLVERAHPASGFSWGTGSVELKNLTPNKSVRWSCPLKGCTYHEDVKQ
jgi:hypothetical protein